MENLHLVSLEVYILVFVVGSLLAADLEVSRGTRSVLNRTAPWDCFEINLLSSVVSFGSLSNDDGDVNENGKKQLV